MKEDTEGKSRGPGGVVERSKLQMWKTARFVLWVGLCLSLAIGSFGCYGGGHYDPDKDPFYLGASVNSICPDDGWIEEGKEIADCAADNSDVESYGASGDEVTVAVVEHKFLAWCGRELWLVKFDRHRVFADAGDCARLRVAV